MSTKGTEPVGFILSRIGREAWQPARAWRAAGDMVVFLNDRACFRGVVITRSVIGLITRSVMGTLMLSIRAQLMSLPVGAPPGQARRH